MIVDDLFPGMKVVVKQWNNETFEIKYVGDDFIISKDIDGVEHCDSMEKWQGLNFTLDKDYQIEVLLEENDRLLKKLEEKKWK